MIILTYFFAGNLLSPHDRLHFPISSTQVEKEAYYLCSNYRDRHGIIVRHYYKEQKNLNSMAELVDRLSPVLVGHGT